MYLCNDRWEIEINEMDIIRMTRNFDVVFG